MTVYCIIDPTGDVVPGSVSDNARSAWMAGILVAVGPFRPDTFQRDLVRMVDDGYRLGRCQGVVFERVG